MLLSQRAVRVPAKNYLHIACITSHDTADKIATYFFNKNDSNQNIIKFLKFDLSAQTCYIKNNRMYFHETTSALNRMLQRKRNNNNNNNNTSNNMHLQ